MITHYRDLVTDKLKVSHTLPCKRKGICSFYLRNHFMRNIVTPKPDMILTQGSAKYHQNGNIWQFIYHTPKEDIKFKRKICIGIQTKKNSETTHIKGKENNFVFQADGKNELF